MTKTPVINTKKRIIQLLQKKGEMRFTDIKNKIGFTDAAISKNLASLYAEGSIEYEKRGREKFYKISDSISKTFARKMNVLANNFTDYLGDELFYDDTDDKNFYSETEKKLSSFLLFTLITSIQTGKNWSNAFDISEMLKIYLGSFATDIISDDKSREEWINNTETMNLDDFFEYAKKTCKPYTITKKVSEKYDTLRKMYPKEIEEYEKLSRY